MKRGRVKLCLDEPPLGGYEVDANIMSEQWAIHADPFLEKGKRYVLTHIPSGKRVWSSKTQMFLKRLIQEPEFLEPLDDTDMEQVRRLSTVITRFCDENTDLTAKPKKIGWE